MNIHKINELPVITAHIPHTRAATVAIWINRGARDETIPEEHGLTHFLEHMVFKGTATRTATDISREIERVGGDLDAFTSRDQLCFIARVPAEQIALGIELLTDMLTRPSFRPENIKLEKSVVREEIRMMRDDPDDSGDELFISGIYPETSLGRSILGTEETVAGFNSEMLYRLLEKCRNPREMVVSIAGHINEKNVCHLLEPLASTVSEKPGSRQDRPQPFFPGKRAIPRNGMTAVNIYMAYPLPAPDLRLQYTVSILNAIYGGGMSSRLFQKVREDSGLAYMVFSSPSFFRKEGHLYVNAGTSAENARTVAEIMEKEAVSLKDSLTESEIEDGRNQLIGKLKLSLETSTSQAMWGGQKFLQYGRIVTLSEALQTIKEISPEEIRTLAAEVFNPDKSATLMYGNLTAFR